MQRLTFSIDIEASKERIWHILWDDKMFRDWANNIDAGMWLVGEMAEGKEMQFMSPTGYGVTSLVEKLTPNEFVSFRHKAGIKDGSEGEGEWTGGEESYRLTGDGAVTTLTVELDTPAEHVDGFTVIIPKALQRIKELSEAVVH